MVASTWFLYVLSCNDGTLYTGITTDVERRVEEHNNSPKGARYTRARRPVTLLATWAHPDRSSASKAEYAFKRLSRKQKQRQLLGASILTTPETSNHNAAPGEAMR